MNNLLTDIGLTVRQKDFRPVYTPAEERRRLPGGSGFTLDLSTLSGRENLGQAIMIRLLTPRGDLTHLGHPGYGSRLHELVGGVNTETTRNLAKLYILEALRQEPRIETVDDVSVTPSPGRRSAIDIRLHVTPAGAVERLTIGPFSLEFD